VKKIKKSEKRAIFSTSPEGLGRGLTNGHLVRNIEMTPYVLINDHRKTCFYGVMNTKYKKKTKHTKKVIITT
jgi:hypothetical protein